MESQFLWPKDQSLFSSHQGKIDTERPLLVCALKQAVSRPRMYKVYLTGAGPGDPTLITVRGRDILRCADVIIYDYLVDKRLLDEARPDAELICCNELGKNRHSGGGQQEKINDLMVKKVKQGKKVIRLKSGDPFIFGRASEEMTALIKNKIGFEVVPGVTAASAASCLSGIPLTDRRLVSSCVFVTGHENTSKLKSFIDWYKIAGSGTIVLYMAVDVMPKIVKELLTAGKSPLTNVAVIKDASLLTHKVLTGRLKDIAIKIKEEGITPPSIVIIGEAAGLEKEFNWLKKTRKILFTGISEHRFFEKDIVFHLPIVKIIPLEDYREFDRSLENIDIYDWIVFSSRYGAQYFFQRLNSIGYDARKFSKAKVAAIGNSTKNKLREFGVIADLVPKDESSKGLINAFKKIDIRNKKVFIPRSDLSDKGLAQGFGSQGAKVTAVTAYKNIMPENLPDIDFDFFDEIRFSSPSGVRNFIKRYGRPPKKIKISSIGAVTRNEVKKWHLLD